MIAGVPLVEASSLGLRTETQLRRLEGVTLRHRLLGPVQAVKNELPEKREANLPGQREILFPLGIDQEQLIAAGFAGDVDILAQFDIAGCAQDHRASVAPGPEPV